MARTLNGRSLEFSNEVKEAAYQYNWDNPPRGCVGYWCEWCKFSSVRRHYFQVDHIVPAARMQEQGLTIEQLTSLENACILCSGCNGSKQHYGFPRPGMGLAYRSPNQNMTHGVHRAEFLNWDDLIRMAQRKGRFQRQS